MPDGDGRRVCICFVVNDSVGKYCGLQFRVITFCGGGNGGGGEKIEYERG